MSYALRIKKSSFQTPSKYQTFLTFLTKKLETHNLRITQEEEETNTTLLQIDIPLEEVYHTHAETQGFYKPIITPSKRQDEDDCFVHQSNYFTKSKSKTFINYDKEEEEFWYPCEKLEILHGLLLGMEIGEDLGFLRGFMTGGEMINGNDSLLYTCMNLGILSELIPLHTSSNERHALFKETLLTLNLSNRFIQKVYKYYGSKVALYFAWMNHFTLWLLCGPAFFGGFIYYHNSQYDDISIDNSRMAPYYTMFVICWGVLFVQYWKRKCAFLTCRWGTIKVDQEERVRCNFKGEVRVSPITGKEEYVFLYYKRLIRYVESMVVTCGMLCIAFGVMVLSLNFQGYIHSNSFGAYMLHFPMIQQFSEPGCIFDPNGSGYWGLIPTIVHAFIINTLNTKYRSIAVSLTENENHRTEDDFENALIIKRFLFEAFDSYIALFFLAFVQCDIVLLRNELVALYTADSARRVITECLIPFLMQMKNRRDRGSHKKDDKESLNNSVLVDELELDEYEQFDDYLEMVIQFGYITIFASAFPLSGLLSIVCNLIEVKSDLFKLTYVVRRPNAIRVSSIGTWLSVLQGIVWLSIITNVFIFAFTTEQMMQIFPSMFVISTSEDVDFGGSDHVHVAVEGKGRWVVGIAVIIEHLLFILAGLVYAAIPNFPASVREELKRREYTYALLLAEKGQK